jgi:hypothetical protein
MNRQWHVITQYCALSRNFRCCAPRSQFHALKHEFARGDEGLILGGPQKAASHGYGCVTFAIRGPAAFISKSIYQTPWRRRQTPTYAPLSIPRAELPTGSR